MKKLVLGFVAVLSVIVVATASAVDRPQHGGSGQKNHPNYLRGPICANTQTGVLRWVLARQKCLSNEVRLIIPRATAGPRGKRGLPGVAGVAGPAGVGTQGDKGDKGDKGDRGAVGATGVQGATGPTGPAGQDGEDGSGLGDGILYACVSNGGTLQVNVNGQPCDNEGHQPLKIVIVQ